MQTLLQNPFHAKDYVVWIYKTVARINETAFHTTDVTAIVMWLRNEQSEGTYRCFSKFWNWSPTCISKHFQFLKTDPEKYPSWLFERLSSNTAHHTSKNTGIFALSLSTYLGWLKLPAENASLSSSTDYKIKSGSYINVFRVIPTLDI